MKRLGLLLHCRPQRRVEVPGKRCSQIALDDEITIGSFDQQLD